MRKFVEQSDGYLKMFREPVPGMIYSMGIDASTGLAEDYSVIQIFSNAIPFEQCAMFRAKLPVHQVAGFADRLGRYYNEALNICEINYPGNSVQDSLLQYYKYPRNYQAETHLTEDINITPKYGFRTTETTKWMLINQTQMMIENKEIRISDPDTIYEMLNYVYLGHKKKVGGSPGFNDDTVISMMLALHGCQLYPCPSLSQPAKISVQTQDPDSRRDWRVFKQMLMQPTKKETGVVL